MPGLPDQWRAQIMDVLALLVVYNRAERAKSLGANDLVPTHQSDVCLLVARLQVGMALLETADAWLVTVRSGSVGESANVGELDEVSERIAKECRSDGDAEVGAAANLANEHPSTFLYPVHAVLEVRRINMKCNM